MKIQNEVRQEAWRGETGHNASGAAHKASCRVLLPYSP